ncbi:DUF4184 family protein [Allorhizocola rhizosphaerae]|uniref:DUF4184 family protein n=1 Tax=Allorhizocola rhizosphaerae TaxID=1872709 RepID=UPI000E3BB6B2|nr:DUF4184 family protein [Allorhizocola rhizosphaerae]
MPFTGSHPAAVLPFLRWGLPASGLVIGSIVPDLPLYFPFLPSVAITHSLWGAVSIDLAMAALVFVAWQALLGPAMVAIAPKPIRDRLPSRAPAGLRFHFQDLRRQLLTVASLTIGTLTHIVWDSFTHKGMWGARHSPMLSGHYGPFAGYEWAQHISSVGGLVIVVVWCWRLPKTPSQRPLMSRRPFAVAAWILMLTSAVLGSLTGALSVVAGGRVRIPDLLFRTITWGVVATLAIMIIIAAAWRLRSHLLSARANHTDRS